MPLSGICERTGSAPKRADRRTLAGYLIQSTPARLDARPRLNCCEMRIAASKGEDCRSELFSLRLRSVPAAAGDAGRISSRTQRVAFETWRTATIKSKTTWVL